MATSKPEVLTTRAVGNIETGFRRLYLGFRGRPGEWNTDRHRNMHAWCNFQHGDLEIGSTYKLGGEQGRDLIPTATPRFSRMLRRRNTV